MEILILGNKDLLKVLHLVLIFFIKKYELCDLLASKSENSFSPPIYFSSTLPDVIYMDFIKNKTW
jgi:hypothetical protein